MKKHTIINEPEYITFYDFVAYGKEVSDNISEDGMPWSFKFYGLPVSHETNDSYVILYGDEMLLFTKDDILVVNPPKNIIYVSKISEINRNPIGLIPKEIHDDIVIHKRFTSVYGAIYRYLDSNNKIPIQWIDEYNELVNHYLK